LHFELVDQTTSKIVYAVDYLNWKTSGHEYDGLPDSEQEARHRVADRVKIRAELVGHAATFSDAPHSPHAPFTLDLRRI
jgi:uncharacterized protein (DUF2126 family)